MLRSAMNPALIFALARVSTILGGSYDRGGGANITCHPVNTIIFGFDWFWLLDSVVSVDLKKN